MTKKGSQIEWARSTTFWTAAALVVIGVYFFGLSIPLVGPDEPRYSQVAREMFDRGDWVTPTLGGFTWFEKPALLYWLQIASYHIFGVTEFAARFGSAIFGIATSGCLWLLGRTVKPLVRNEGFEFGNLLGLVSASSIGIIVFARGASFDIILTLPVTAALVSFYYYERKVTLTGGRDISIIFALIGFYVFVGVALIAKGLVGIVFPYGIVSFYFLLSKRFPSRPFVIILFWGTLLAIAVASVWYLPVYLQNGWPFVDEFFIQHHFQRYTSNKYFHPQPFYFFLLVLPLMTIPWLPFFASGLWTSIRELFPGRDKAAEEGDPERRQLGLFSLAWMLVPLVFFSFSGSKLPGYILPSLPPAIVLASLSIDKFVVKSRKRRSFVLSTAAATFLVIVGLLIWVVPNFADDESVKRLIEAADNKGYSTAEVIGLHTLSHNAEFYAAGRLLRTADGKQVKFYGVSEVADEVRRKNGQPVLVLVPNEYAFQTVTNPLIRAEIIAQNRELSILAVRGRLP